MHQISALQGLKCSITDCDDDDLISMKCDRRRTSFDIEVEVYEDENLKNDQELA
jgi:hypothetical protein